MHNNGIIHVQKVYKNNMMLGKNNRVNYPLILAEGKYCLGQECLVLHIKSAFLLQLGRRFFEVEGRLLAQCSVLLQHKCQGYPKVCSHC